MNISSTPFIRNDYWPDYNDIDILNKRIDEAENETSLVNSRLTNDIENVSNNLNSYKNEMADTVITNNIIVNNLNANYAIGKYANFINTNTDNAYIENLTVNKPVFDLTLNTPHVENITSIGGNFYDANMFNVAIDNLLINTQSEPVTSSAVLGYDGEGRVIPIKAAFEVGFPENANYLYTDQYGTAFPGTAETEVNASDNLITSNAVYNALANVNNSFNDTNNNFVNIDNNFNDVANNFNAVNNTANNLLDNVDYLKTTLAPLLSLPVANVSGWVNSKSPVNIQGITSFVVTPFAALVMTGSDVGDGAKLNVSGTTATLALPGFQWTKENMNRAFFGCRNFNQNVQIPNGVISMVSTFGNCNCYNVNIVPSSYTGNVYDYINSAMANAVSYSFNQNIAIPNGVVNMSSTFYRTVLNQNILIPNSVSDLSKAFSSGREGVSIPLRYENGSFVTIGEEMVQYDVLLSQFNQNIAIPNGVVNMSETFGRAACLNQNILIPNSVSDLSYTFAFCVSLNQNILIPNSATNINNMISNYIPSVVTKLIKDNVVYDVDGSMAFNQPNMYIFSQNITDMANAFRGCHINNVHIPASVPKDTSNFMYNCLVNGATGITFPAANIFNDLPVDTQQWPPV